MGYALAFVKLISRFLKKRFLPIRFVPSNRAETQRKKPLRRDCLELIYTICDLEMIYCVARI
jgi:hypothetical protein